jgi:hypothetical protein
MLKVFAVGVFIYIVWRVPRLVKHIRTKWRELYV